MRRLGQQFGEAPADRQHQRRGRLGRRALLGQRQPFMRAAAIGEIAAQGLAAIEPTAVDAAERHQRQRLGHDHLAAGGLHRDFLPQKGGESPGLRPGGEHEAVAADLAAIGLDGGDAAAGAAEAGDGGVLQDAPAMVLHRPGIALQRAVRIGMAAELVVIAADDGVARQRHQLLRLPGVEHLRWEALPFGIAQCAAIERHLLLARGEAYALRPEFGGIAEQLVHHRPEPLLLGEEGRMMVRAAAAIAAGGFPADQPLLQNQHVDAVLRQPPAGGKPCDAAADDDDGCSLDRAHRRRLIRSRPGRSRRCRRRCRAPAPPRTGATAHACRTRCPNARSGRAPRAHEPPSTAAAA